ncbi:MAG: carbohydrate kinase family protein [Candidatus Eisenbacteria bacterium]|uniref:Carbohydrate kinase family protein n=1 Tax=Eiseniibacteriota bacterium TaxID=2212470 RepID=A0A933SF08_UNCEI|nr:carbohydrate kinase family protein [Candidatus Eisenbacteria bacterium]
MTAAPELVLLGNLLVDDIVFPDGSTRMAQPGGAILHSSIAAALWGTRVGCVSLLGDDYPVDALERLERHGVMLDGVRRLGRDGLRTWLLYEGRVRRVVHRLACPTHEEVSPEADDVPEAWRNARAFHLAPMPIALQERVVKALGGERAFVSVDPYELVTESSLERWRAVLAHADAFFPSEDELRLDGAAEDPRGALERLACGRLRFVFAKRGAAGGLLFDAHTGRFHEWEARTEAKTDPTGAGDGFAAGFLSAHLEGLPVDRCIQRAVVTASFAIQAWGPEALFAAARADAEQRLHTWYPQESVS